MSDESFLYWGKVLQYLKGKVVLSICMHTKKGYSENWTVVMKSRDASVSKLTSTPALMKSMSTVMLPVTTSAPLKPQAGENQLKCVQQTKLNKSGWFHRLRLRLRSDFR